MKNAVKAITNVKKSAKATADVKPLKIKNTPNQADNFAIFQVKFFTENHVFSSPAMSDLQAISARKYFLHEVHKGLLPSWSSVNFGHCFLNKIQEHTAERSFQSYNKKPCTYLPDTRNYTQWWKADATPETEKYGH